MTDDQQTPKPRLPTRRSALAGKPLMAKPMKNRPPAQPSKPEAQPVVPPQLAPEPVPEPSTETQAVAEPVEVGPEPAVTDAVSEAPVIAPRIDPVPEIVPSIWPAPASPAPRVRAVSEPLPLKPAPAPDPEAWSDPEPERESEPSPEPELALESDPSPVPEPPPTADAPEVVAVQPTPAPVAPAPVASAPQPVAEAPPYPQTVRELMRRVDEAWPVFRAMAARFPSERMDERLTEDGWTRKQMLAHVAAWHDLAADRVIKLINTGRSVPLDRSPDAVNAAVARQAIGKTAGEVLKDIEATFNRLRRQMQRLTDAQLRIDDWWAVKMIAGDTYEHYQEHYADIYVPEPPPGSGARR